MNERCERLAHHVLEGPLRDDVVAWIRDVALLQQYRNAIVHSNWSSKVLVEDGEIGPAAVTHRAKARQGLITRVTAHKPEDIRRQAGATAKAMLDGTSLIMELQLWAETERQSGGLDLRPWTRPAPTDPTTGQTHAPST